MSDTLKILSELREPFHPDQVRWRVGTAKDGGMATVLAYVDARAVMERLDATLGPRWQDSYTELRAFGRSGGGDAEYNGKKQVRRSSSVIVCTISLYLELLGGAWQWVGRSDGGVDSAVEADKGAISDAFKRAAVHWGIGRELYAMPYTVARMNGKAIDRSELPRLAGIAQRVLEQYRRNPLYVPDDEPEPTPPPSPAGT